MMSKSPLIQLAAPEGKKDFRFVGDTCRRLRLSKVCQNGAALGRNCWKVTNSIPGRREGARESILETSGVSD